MMYKDDDNLYHLICKFMICSYDHLTRTIETHNINLIEKPLTKRHGLSSGSRFR